MTLPGVPDKYGFPAPTPDYDQLESQIGPAGRQALQMTGPGGSPSDLSIAQRGGTLNIPAWFEQKYQSSQDWSAMASNFALVGGASATPTAFTFTCPAMQKGVVQQITVTVQNILAASTVTWALLRNDAPFPGFNSQLIAPCSATAIIIPYNDLALRFDQGDKITFRITESGGNSYTCAVSASGWFTPMADIERLQSGITI